MLTLPIRFVHHCKNNLFFVFVLEPLEGHIALKPLLLHKHLKLLLIETYDHEVLPIIEDVLNVLKMHQEYVPNSFNATYLIIFVLML